jgi:hypothetical protein
VKRAFFRHEFVDFVPDELQDGVVYVSVEYATAVHSCACGCGREVVTPLSPADWSLTFDGETISLNPSIGNWSFPCQSHYWIRHDKVAWAGQWSAEEITAGRERDRALREDYYRPTTKPIEIVVSADAAQTGRLRTRIWRRLRRGYRSEHSA